MAAQAGHLHVAEALFAIFCVAAAIAALLLPIETKGRALMVRPSDPWGRPQPDHALPLLQPDHCPVHTQCAITCTIGLPVIALRMPFVTTTLA